jgi:hypothetical protein
VRLPCRGLVGSVQMIMSRGDLHVYFHRRRLRAHRSRSDLLTLLCLSSGRRGCRRLGGEGGAGVRAVELAGDVALEAALDLTAGLALGYAVGDVVLGGRAAPHAGDGDGVDCAVQGPVAAAVEPVPDRSAAAGRQRGGARQRSECGVVSAPSGVGETTRWLERR